MKYGKIYKNREDGRRKNYAEKMKLQKGWFGMYEKQK